MADATSLNMIQGETYNMSLTWATDGEPNSLELFRAHMQIRRRLGQTGDPVVDLSSETESPAITIEPGGETGVIVVRVPANLTELLTKPVYYYDLFIVERLHPDNALRMLHGPVNVSQSVTIDPVAVTP